MNILKLAVDIILLILGLSTFASLPSLVHDMSELAARDAHPKQYLSLKKWTHALTSPRDKKAHK